MTAPRAPTPKSLSTTIALQALLSLGQEQKKITTETNETKELQEEVRYSFLKFYHSVKFESFHRVCFHDEKTFPKEVKGILALDFDDTLIDYDKTVKAKKGVTIEREVIHELIVAARKQAYLVVCITAREYQEAGLLNHPLAIGQILQEISPDNFSYLFFTAGQDKVPALESLRAVHNLESHQCVLVDDDLGYLVHMMKAGFVGIPVFQIDHKFHPKLIEKFLKGTLINESYSKYVGMSIKEYESLVEEHKATAVPSQKP